MFEDLGKSLRRQTKGHPLGSKTYARAKKNETWPRWLENIVNKQEVLRETGSSREKKRIQEVDLQKNNMATVTKREKKSRKTNKE